MRPNLNSLDNKAVRAARRNILIKDMEEFDFARECVLAALRAILDGNNAYINNKFLYKCCKRYAEITERMEKAQEELDEVAKWENG